MPDPTEQKYWLPGVAEAEEVGSGMQRSLLLELPGSPGCLPSAALLETGWPLSGGSSSMSSAWMPVTHSSHCPSLCWKDQS